MRTVLHDPTIPSPLDGVNPDISVFGPQLKNVADSFIGGVWAVCMAGVVVALAFSLAKAAWAKRHGQVDDMGEALKHAQIAGVALAGLAGLSVIVGAILYFVAKAQA